MPKNNDLVRYDANGYFEIQDEALRPLAEAEIALVAGGTLLTDGICNNIRCGGDALCVGPGPTINGRCPDGDGRNEFLTHGNHTLNGVC